MDDIDQGQYGQQFIPEMGRAGSQGYSAEHYKFLNEIIESKAAREFYIQISQAGFSNQCVKAFFKILTSGFDKNAILARNKNIDIRKIDFEIALNLMVVECLESDTQNPAFLTFRENIKQTFIDFISRSENASERDKLLKQEYGIVNDERQHQNSQPQQGGMNPLQRFGRQQ